MFFASELSSVRVKDTCCSEALPVRQKNEENCFPAAVFPSPKKVFSLTCYAKHNKTHRRWFSFSTAVVYDGSLLECHDAFENNLMMVCHWTRILSLSKKIYRFLFLHHTFHEFLTWYRKCLLRVPHRKWDFYRSRGDFLMWLMPHFMCDNCPSTNLFILFIPIVSSFPFTHPQSSECMTKKESLMPHAHQPDLLNFPLPRHDLP